MEATAQSKPFSDWAWGQESKLSEGYAVATAVCEGEEITRGVCNIVPLQTASNQRDTCLYTASLVTMVV